MCYFHRRCEDGVEALRHYKREFNDEKKVFSDKPEHDWASHAADSFRYLALVAQGLKTEDSEEKKIIVPAQPKMYLEELFQERERRMRWIRRT
jgi:hypothetical protein